MKKVLVFLALGAVFTSAAVVSVTVPAEIPHEINYQGMLTDDEDNPLNGSYDILFKIYNHPSSGSMLWDELQEDVSVEEGLFNVVLGSVDPIVLSFYEVDQYWLDITVEGEHMPSRVNFASVAFAYRAQKADTAAYAVAVPEGDLDARYVNVIGPDSIRGSSSSTLFRVRNTGTGHGIYVHTYGASGTGIVIDTAGDYGIYIEDTGDDGIYLNDIHQDGIYMTDTDDDGIQMYNIGDDGISMDNIGNVGIYMDDVADDGIYMHDIEGDGIYINDAADYGLYINTADYAVYVDSTRANYDGFWVRYAEDDGFYVSHADDAGLYVSDAGNDGVYVYHADRYGLYIYDSDNDGIRVQSADGDGIEAHSSCQGGQFFSGSSGCFGLVAHSYQNLNTRPGLYVYGYGYASGGFSKSVSGSSGDVPAFTICSRDIELIASGTGTLVAGQAQISFELEFQEAISPEVPLRVVVTAQDAPSALLYVTGKSTQGFTVKPLEIPELSLKTDNVSFDWIAIARQKGYEQRPEVLILSEEESRAEELNREEEMRAEELKHQEELEREAAYRQEMAEKQARKEAERREREKEEQSTD